MIWFNSTIAREYLEANGLIYTARKSRKQFGKTLAVYTDGMYGRVSIGYVNVELADKSIESDINHNHRSVLSKYVENSGFVDIADWTREIQRLNSNRWLPTHLKILKVTMVDD